MDKSILFVLALVGVFLTGCAAPEVKCGNGVCDPDETYENCPADCVAPGPVCGNGVCEAGETYESCPADCAAPGPVCGNGVCESGETQASCPVDCGEALPAGPSLDTLIARQNALYMNGFEYDITKTTTSGDRTFTRTMHVWIKGIDSKTESRLTNSWMYSLKKGAKDEMSGAGQVFSWQRIGETISSCTVSELEEDKDEYISFLKLENVQSPQITGREMCNGAPYMIDTVGAPCTIVEYTVYRIATNYPWDYKIWILDSSGTIAKHEAVSSAASEIAVYSNIDTTGVPDSEFTEPDICMEDIWS